MKCVCGKQLYPSEWRAVEAIQKANARRGWKLTRAYRCPTGSGWHITAQTKRRRKMMEELWIPMQLYNSLPFEEKLQYLQNFMNKWITARVHHALQKDPRPLPNFKRYIIQKMKVRIRRMQRKKHITP